MDPLQASELFRHMDFNALGKQAHRPLIPHRPHLLRRLRNSRRRPRE
jgi:hypothetical protein